MRVRKTALGEAVLEQAALRKAGVAGIRSKIVTADAAIMARISAADSPLLDQVLPALGRAANYSRLWLGLAAGLAASESTWGRRAALRGVAGIVIASTVTNVAGKSLARRLRPTADVPLARQLSRGPRSTSFPSGHAASAAAFATGVALEVPALAVPVGALAGAVGVSRVVTGVHFPSDVAAGFAIGACASLATVHWWPLRRPEPAAAGNCQTPASRSPARAATCRTCSKKAADRARILGVAGGDGLVQVAAGLAADKGLPLLVRTCATASSTSG